MKKKVGLIIALILSFIVLSSLIKAADETTDTVKLAFMANDPEAKRNQ